MLLLSIMPLCHGMNRACIMFKPTAADDLETLRNLRGLDVWPKRKKLIMKMIKNDPRNVDIESRKYDKDTPLHESITHHDAPFVLYLSQYNLTIEKMNSHNITPLYNVIEKLNYATEHPSLDDISKQPHLLCILKLLIIKGANPDYEMPFKLNNFDIVNATPRRKANPEVRLFIEQVEQEKTIREYLLVAQRITKEPAKIVAGYLNQDAYITPERIDLVITEIEAENELLLEINALADGPIITAFKSILARLTTN